MEESTVQEKLLTYREAGKVLRVSDRTVWALCHQSKVLPVVRIGRKCFVLLADVVAYIRQQRQQSITSKAGA